MKPADVHAVLQGIRAEHLHHANTVLTSCTFLEQGGLLSRNYVESRGLKQTPQNSDPLDKTYGIWNRVFLDHVDIHYRGGRKKGPNQYGPVLFRFDVGILLTLPPGTDILVTQANPVNWPALRSENDRFYVTTEELSKNLHFGDFDKMLVIEIPGERLEFPANFEILLDDPKRRLSLGEDAYAHADACLQAAARKGGGNIAVSPHACRGDCICVQKYGKYDPVFFGSRFQL